MCLLANQPSRNERHRRAVIAARRAFLDAIIDGHGAVLVMNDAGGTSVSHVDIYERHEPRPHVINPGERSPYIEYDMGRVIAEGMSSAGRQTSEGEKP